MENEEKIEAETPVVEAEIAPEVEAEEEKPVSIQEQPEITIETFGTRMCTCGMEVTLEDQPVKCSCGVNHIK